MLKLSRSNTTQTQKQTTDEQKVGRQAEIEKDVSNGRLELWESGVEVWKTTPIWGPATIPFFPL